MDLKADEGLKAPVIPAIIDPSNAASIRVAERSGFAEREEATYRGAPILLLMGASPVGYAVGAGAWIVLRLVGVGLDRYLAGSADARQEISLRLAYLMARVFLLALAVILVRKSDGKDAGFISLRDILLRDLTDKDA